MSRAMNISMQEADVVSICETAKISISATETLLSGGTRLVLTTSSDADAARIKFRKHLMDGKVRRMHTLWARQR